MNREAVRALSDSDLAEVSLWVDGEIKDRANKRKADAIARIKAIAGELNLSVAIGGQRGRPSKMKKGGKG